MIERENNMFELSKDKLKELGAEITTREIKQQPQLWKETAEILAQNQEKLTLFFDQIKKAANGKRVRVIFTGAGTSQYVGDTAVPYLNEYGDNDHFIFHSFGTTDIVSSPKEFLFPYEPTLLVSFARSGNSPESVATVKIVNEQIKTLFHLTITCAKEGQLAKNAATDDRNYLLLMPEKSNDAGFAMTGSFTCMLLSALWVFDQTTVEKKESYLQQLIRTGEDLISRDQEIQKLLPKSFERIAYLGSGSLAGATREAQLKILELTAGKVATIFDSSMGFRHGPKSFLNSETLVIGFVNNQPYTRNYDLDILEEIKDDQITTNVIAIAQPGNIDFTGTSLLLEASISLPDAYLALPMIMTAQIIALDTSIKVANKPDTPSPTGTVNRVVKGVIIHEYVNKGETKDE